MAKLMFSVFAQRVAVDRFTNWVDVLSVLEQLEVPAPPVQSPNDGKGRARGKQPVVLASGKFALLIHWRRTDVTKGENQLRQRVELVGPNGKRIGSPAELEFSLRDSHYARNVVSFEGLPIVGEGTYAARVYLKSGARWRRMGETSFEVAYRKPALPNAKTRIH